MGPEGIQWFSPDSELLDCHKTGRGPAEGATPLLLLDLQPVMTVPQPLWTDDLEQIHYIQHQQSKPGRQSLLKCSAIR